MGAKYGILCSRALHQWAVFLPSQGRTLTHVIIPSEITCYKLYGKHILWNLGASWKYHSNTPLVHEAIHHVSTMVTYLPTKGMDTPHLQVHSVLW